MRFRVSVCIGAVQKRNTSLGGDLGFWNCPGRPPIRRGERDVIANPPTDRGRHLDVRFGSDPEGRGVSYSRSEVARLRDAAASTVHADYARDAKANAVGHYSNAVGHYCIHPVAGDR